MPGCFQGSYVYHRVSRLYMYIVGMAPIALNKSNDSELRNVDVISLSWWTACRKSASYTQSTYKIHSYSDSHKIVIVHHFVLLLIQFKWPTAKRELVIAPIFSRESQTGQCNSRNTAYNVLNNIVCLCAFCRKMAHRMYWRECWICATKQLQRKPTNFWTYVARWVHDRIFRAKTRSRGETWLNRHTHTDKPTTVTLQGMRGGIKKVNV